MKRQLSWGSATGSFHGSASRQFGSRKADLTCSGYSRSTGSQIFVWFSPNSFSYRGSYFKCRGEGSQVFWIRFGGGCRAGCRPRYRPMFDWWCVWVRHRCFGFVYGGQHISPMWMWWCRTFISCLVLLCFRKQTLWGYRFKNWNSRCNRKSLSNTST